MLNNKLLACGCSTLMLLGAMQTANAIDEDAKYNVVFFGDSLVDSRPTGINLIGVPVGDRFKGNDIWSTREDGGIGAPYTSSLGPIGLLRNVWPNYLVSSLNSENQLKTQGLVPRRFFDDGSQPFNPVLDNIDYAFAGAVTGKGVFDQNGLPDNCNDTIGPINGDVEQGICFPGYGQQVHTFLDDVEINGNDGALDTTITFTFIGGNDLFNGLTVILSGEDPGDFVTEAVENVIAGLTEQLNVGIPAENLYLNVLPDISKTPAALLLTEGDEELLATISEISQAYSGALVAIGDAIPGINIVRLDEFFNLVIDDGDPIFFDDTTSDCVASGGAPQCLGFAFYDAKHPTTVFYQAISDFILEGIQINS